MNRYESYLETGFEWIGKIPSSWELSRVGKFFTERSEKVDDVTYPPLSVTMNGIVDQLSDVAKSNDNDNRKLVKKDDFVINSRSDRKGSSGIAPRDGSVSLINIVLAPKNIDPKYIENLFKSYYFKEEYFRNGKGIHWDLWTTRWEQFKNINIPIPPIEEQKLISRYLDKKTSQIDSLVEKIQKKIELLKEQRTSLINHYVTKGLDPNVEMKDSGIEWVGYIPSSWNVKPVWSLSKIVSRTNEEDKELLSVFLDKGVVKFSDVGAKRTNVTSESLEKYQLVKPGNLVLNNQQAWRGSVGVSKYEGIVSPAYFILELNKELDPDFANYLFRDQSVVINFLTSSKGVGTIQRNLYFPHFSRTKICVPPLTEQRKIVDILDTQTKNIDEISDKLSNKIDLIKEYRQSLISAVVTGKVRVTEDMI